MGVGVNQPSLARRSGEAWSHGHAVVNGVRFHYVEAGTGPLVVLLHGFPEFWYAWRHQISALAAAGFHVVAPDLRGYNQSAKPAGVCSYRMELLVGDVLGLIQRAGAARAVVVGHDWGGVIAWKMAMDHPEVVDRLAILNAPHPAAFQRELRGLRQRLRSLYILFFQLPFLPECLLRAGDYALLERKLRREPVHGAFSAADIRRYRLALAIPRALTSALNYYRAAWRFSADTQAIRPIPVPTLIIWGERDRYLGVRLTEGLAPWVPNLRVERLAEASHWVQNDAPQQVNRLLLDFLGRG
jgi:pimeloyl-ACP methyl ester carboxylesterase